MRRCFLLQYFRLKSFMLIALWITLAFNSYADGGMYPVNQLDSAKLKSAGLKISVKDIYNPNGVSLMQAIVSLGGCTGSFVSPDGLILTNHHCVFSAVAALSTTQNNILQNGFSAVDRESEIPLKGMSVKIMINYEDVSTKVLKDVEKISDPIKRKDLIEANIQMVLREEKNKNPDMMVELSEMMTGKSYIIIRYQFFKDVRLVYVPPKAIGEFGGETDNWMWPRHSGDFSFIRVYTAPNGSPSAYSGDNIPLKPSKYIQINTNGVKENDFIFILGYPGRTFRNRPSAFVNYSEKVQMPFIADYFEYRINEMLKLSAQNEEKKLKYESQIKALANTSKNYRGKLKSMAAIKLYQQKQAEELQIIKLLSQSPEKAREFELLLSKFDSLYAVYATVGKKNLWYSQFFNVSPNFEIARLLVSYYKASTDPQVNKSDLEKIYGITRAKINELIDNQNLETDSLFVRRLLEMAIQEPNLFSWVHQYFGQENTAVKLTMFIKNAYHSYFSNKVLILGLLDKPASIRKSKNLFIQLVFSMIDDMARTSEDFRLLNSTIDALLPQYVELKMLATGNEFIPDANSTFRMTYGYIRGYYPQDAVYCFPFATLDGVIEKMALGGDYEFYQPLVTAIDNTRVVSNAEKQSDSFTVNFLYNADTTGGNSGSPVLNAYGELVGLNFDRTFEATINDFAWNESYSRSIGVDIRYIIFVLDKVSHADYVLRNIKN